MDRLLVAGLLVLGAVALAYVLQRRQPDEPIRSAWSAPSWVDRADFVAPDAPWLVVVFTSATCRSCRNAAEGALALADEAVAVQEVEVQEAHELHERYGIDAVPTVVIVDAAGEVRASFVGPPAGTELPDRLAELCEPPGSAPPGGGPA